MKLCTVCNRGINQQRTIFFDEKDSKHYCEVHAREGIIPNGITLPERYSNLAEEAKEFIAKLDAKPPAVVRWYKHRGVKVKLEWVKNELF